MKAEEIVQKLRDSDYCENMPDCEVCKLREVERCACADNYNGLYAAAADLIENQAREIEALAQANAAKRDELENRRWIPVEEALPKSPESVIGFIPSNPSSQTVSECYFVYGKFYSVGGSGARKVTHWMPMPEFEEAEKDG